MLALGVQTVSTAAKPKPKPKPKPTAEQTMRDKALVANEASVLAGDGLLGGSMLPEIGPPMVQLRADRRETADQLVAKYGDRIQVVLGLFSYPNPNVFTPSWPARKCEKLPKATGRFGKLEPVSAVTLRTNSGGTATGIVTLRNTSPSAVEIRNSALSAVVTRRGSTAVVGYTLEATYSVPEPGRVEPNNTFELSVTAATASCIAKLGWALPPGSYTAHFFIGRFDDAGQGPSTWVTTLSLEITNDPAPPVKVGVPVPQVTVPPI